MARVSSMLARVGRLEVADAHALSPFERDYGSLENMALAWRAMMDAGTLDRLDGEVLIAVVFRWRRDRCWEAWR